MTVRKWKIDSEEIPFIEGTLDAIRYKLDVYEAEYGVNCEIKVESLVRTYSPDRLCMVKISYPRIETEEEAQKREESEKLQKKIEELLR